MRDISNSDSSYPTLWIAGFITTLFVLLAVAPSYAITKTEAADVDAKANEALKAFEVKMPQAKDLLKGAKGFLVMPALYKAGFIGAAQYGEGVLRVDEKTVDYYNLAALSFGFQAGIEKTSLILIFNSDDALATFRKNPGFEIGVDANVTLITVGETGSFDSTKAGQPILAFVFGQRGLMAGVSLKGAKFTRLEKPMTPAPRTAADANLEILMQKVKADKKLLVANNMELTDAEAQPFWPLYDAYQEDLNQINERLGKTIMDYADAAKKGSVPNDTAQRLLNEVLAVEQSEVNLKRSYAEKLGKVLPETKAARYIQIENKIRAAVKASLAQDIPLIY